jgi:outer membrane protein TolC
VKCQAFADFRVTWLDDHLHAEADAQGELDGEVEHVHLSCFQVHPTLSERFQNPRLEAIRVEQLEKTERLHDRAMKGALAAKQLKDSLRQPQASLKPTVSSAIQSQKQREKKKLSPNGQEEEKSVLHTVQEDRSGSGFTQLIEEVIKHAPIWPKEIP